MVWFPVLHVGWLVTVQVRVLEFLFNDVATVMVTVNTVQILDALMIAVFSELEERCSQEALEYWHRHLWYGLTIQSNAEATSQKDGEPPKQPLKLVDWLIDRGLKDGIRLYGKNELKQIANYLLIYCGDENE